MAQDAGGEGCAQLAQATRSRGVIQRRVPVGPTQRDVHVHVWRAGSDDERRHLLFRDWLRESADDRRLYESVKRELATRSWVDSNDYADAKTDVVTVILNHAETWSSQAGWST